MKKIREWGIDASRTSASTRNEPVAEALEATPHFGKPVAEALEATRASVRVFMFVLLSFFLILSCENPASGVKKPAMGYVTISLAQDADARAIMPPTPDYADFKQFRLRFINYINGGYSTIYRVLENLEDPVQLAVGEYELEITAYLDVECTKPAAYAELKDDNRVVLTQGRGVRYVITLNAIADDSVFGGEYTNGTGKFRWSIPCEFKSSVNVRVNMTITSLRTNQQVYNQDLAEERNGLQQLNGSVTLKGEYELPVGYYNVVFTLTTIMYVENLNGAAGETQVPKTVVIREVLHVYRYLDSLLYDMVFTDENFDRTYFTVTFVWNDYVNVSAVRTCAYGKPSTRPNNPTGWPAGEFHDLYVFGDWYSDPYLTAYMRYDFDTPVYGDITLYAKWKGNLAYINVIREASPVYNGQPQNWKGEVLFEGEYLRGPGEFYDYTMTCSNNIRAGIATALVTANEEYGNYVGGKTFNYAINPKPVIIIATVPPSRNFIAGNDRIDVSTTYIRSLDGLEEGLVSGPRPNPNFTGTWEEGGPPPYISDPDDVTVRIGTAYFPGTEERPNGGPEPGKDKTVLFNNFGLEGPDASNYILSKQPASVKATIRGMTPFPGTVYWPPILYPGQEDEDGGYKMGELKASVGTTLRQSLYQFAPENTGYYWSWTMGFVIGNDDENFGRGSNVFYWTNPDDLVGEPGTRMHSMTFAPENTDYPSQTRMIPVTVVDGPVWEF